MTHLHKDNSINNSVKAEQLSLFPSKQSKSKPTAKKAKLGRDERLQRELEKNDNDPNKIYMDSSF